MFLESYGGCLHVLDTVVDQGVHYNHRQVRFIDIDSSRSSSRYFPE